MGTIQDSYFDVLGCIQISLATLSVILAGACVKKITAMRRAPPPPVHTPEFDIVRSCYHIIFVCSVLFFNSQIFYFFVSHVSTSEQRASTLYRALRVAHDVCYDMSVLLGIIIYLWWCHNNILVWYSSVNMSLSATDRVQLKRGFWMIYFINVLAYAISDVCRPLFDQLAWSVFVLVSMFVILFSSNLILWLTYAVVRSAQLEARWPVTPPFVQRMACYKWYLTALTAGSLVSMSFQIVRLLQYLSEFSDLVYFGSPQRIDPFSIVIVFLLYTPVIYWWQHGEPPICYSDQQDPHTSVTSSEGAALQDLRARDQTSPVHHRSQTQHVIVQPLTPVSVHDPYSRDSLLGGD
eukprot:TRINITY_DN6330_c0_g1_i1.p1 TRINITY_DN6330_c0_g1~~TRINITY_DN6330_c0_g1_i1.p1  ORF type:complete len:350 (-),score=18.11 TRINITY_DN6330_c0_g1_i1:169-1218(-)